MTDLVGLLCVGSAWIVVTMFLVWLNFDIGKMLEKLRKGERNE